MSGAGPANYISAGFSFGSTLEAGRSQSNSLKYNAEVSDNQADTIHSQGVAAGQSLDRSIRRTVGAARAAYGGSGVDMSTGSPMDVLADSMRQGTLDKLTSKYNYDVQESTYRDQAKLFRIGAKNAITSAFISAIMNGASAMAGGSASSNPNALGGGSPMWTGGNSLTGGTYVGSGSTSTSWPGADDAGSQWSGGNSLTGGTYNGLGSTSTSWPGSTNTGGWL